ncbi:MAG: peptidase MA family metallohydrolase [Dehalococcoidia bacterium]
MKRVVLGFLAMALVLPAVWYAASPLAVAAFSGVVVDSNEATNNFPDGATFSLSFHGPAVANAKATFHYTIAPEGAPVYEEPTCTGTSTITCTFDLKSDSKLFLVPGAVVTYFWEIDDGSGNKTDTPQATFVYDDTRYQWKSMTDGNLTLWYYGASESDVRSLLQVGTEDLQRMEQLTATQVTFPVKVYLYDTAQEMGPAALSNQSAPGEGLVTLGEVFFADTAVVALDQQPDDILRHELAHIVVKQAVKGPFGDLPAWLNEGVAVYAQSKPDADESRALQDAIAANDVLSLGSISSSSSALSASKVSLFYGESWSLASYLIDQFGADKFAQLLATFKAGSTVDAAFQKVYGFDQAGFEASWRESVGLPPKQSGEQQAQPTGQPQSSSSSGASSGKLAASAGLIALAALIVCASVVLRTRRRRR